MGLAVKGCVTLLGLIVGAVLWYQRRQVKREVNRYRDQMKEWRKQIKKLR